MRDRKVTALFAADAHHNKNSKVLLGIFDNKDTAIKAIKPTLKSIADDNFADMGYTTAKQLCDDLVSNLQDNDQTQSLSENYVIETILVNEINL